MRKLDVPWYICLILWSSGLVVGILLTKVLS
jgi:hypothetical protein